MYANKAKGIIEDHDKDTPLFLYMALQNIHTPLESPQEYMDVYPGALETLGITGKRKQAMAMVTAVDDLVKAVIDKLEAENMMDNSIVIFSSDNGGQPTAGGASNWPLRGAKNTWFEGGVRVPSWIYSPLFDEAYTNQTSDW